MKKTILTFLLVIISFYGFSQTCSLAVTLSSPDSIICLGSNVTLIAKSTGGIAPYKYSWSTGDTTSTIVVNKAGTYQVTVNDQTPGCQAIIKSITINSIQPPAAPTAKGLFVCHTGPVVLTATAPGGMYQWYDSANGGKFLGSGDTLLTPSIKATTAFYVQTTVSGCTSSRTAVTVQMANKPTVSGSVVCANTPATLVASGADSYVWYDSPTGGNILSTSPTLTTKNLSVTTTFYLAATTNGCTADRIPEIANVLPQIPPPVAKNVSVCSGNTANLHADVPQGIISWYAQPAGGIALITSPDFTTPQLTSTTTYYAENALNGCVSLRTPVVVTVNPNPSLPVNQTDSICYNSSTVLTASINPSGTYQWYDSPVAGNLLTTGNTFTTPVLKYSATYYVQNSNTTCSSDRAAIKVLVKAPILPPSVSHPLICQGSSATLKATSPGGIYQWYDAPSGGSLLATGPEFVTPTLLTGKTYYVQTTLSGCVSERVAVPVAILPNMPLPLVANAAICSGGFAILKATGSNGGYMWYDSQNGGNLLASDQTFVTPALTKTTIYYVASTSVLGCPGTRVPVTVAVNAIPAMPNVASVQPICPGSSATLSASSSGGTIQWYDSSNKLLATGNTFTTASLFASTTYYAQNVTSSCVSERVAVTVNVNVVHDPQFRYPAGSVCSSAPNNLSPVIYNPAGGTFSSSPQGLVFVDKNTGEISTALSQPGTYTITFVSKGNCPSITTAGITISHNLGGGFAYNETYCKNAPNPLPKFAAGASAGYFTATPSGLVFVNDITGEINLAASKPGFYTVTNNISGSGCGARDKKSTVTILQPVSVSAGPPQTVNAGQPVQLHGIIKGATGKWSGGKGSFSNTGSPNAIYMPATGETIDTLTFTSNNPKDPCGQQSSSVIVTFLTSQTLEVCLGSAASLSPQTPAIGDTYKWYDAPTEGNLLSSSATYFTPPLDKTTTYYLQTTNGGITGKRTPVTVVINSTLSAPVVSSNNKICEGSFAILTANGSAGQYEWYDAPTGGNLLALGNTYTTPALTENTSYYVQSSLYECISARAKVTISVLPVPRITSPAAGIICSGDNQNYTITANIPNAGYLWSRAQIAGISNPAISNQTAKNINEALINTGTVPINVTYKIVATNGQCSGDPFFYTVTVNPKSTITSNGSDMVCAVAPDNYNFTFNIPSTTISWSRPAVNGISNQAVAGQEANDIKEYLFNTTNLPVNVLYTVTDKNALCDSQPFKLMVTVNPTVGITSPSSGTACTGVPQNYIITSNVAAAKFVWSRAAVANISNAAVTNKTSDTVSETLINTGSWPVLVTYAITASAYGCTSGTFNYSVLVYPVLTAPVARSNSPVCSYSIIQLNTPTVTNATYLWTGPNGFTSSQQSPAIKNVTAANAGTYNLNIIVNGCESPAGSVDVKIDEQPKSNAGPDQIVCRATTAVMLVGSVTGGTSTGVWSTNGTGKFSPAANQLNAVYLLSVQDKLKDSVILTLSSTSKDDCSISTSTMSIVFGKLQGDAAGPDQDVCAQSATAALQGKIFTNGKPVWSTSGTGTFTPSANVLNPTYNGSPDDVKSGSVVLTLTETSGDTCFIHTSPMTVRFIPPPSVYAGGTRYVLVGNTITLNPTVSDKNVHYLWSPNTGIDNDTLKNPVITGEVNRTYTLTVTDSRGCQSQDQVMVKVSPEIKVPNTFTPNGDGINDYWDIKGMVAYVNATVDIFNRYGQSVYHSIGYNQAWDGTYNGKALPTGTYYYVINTKLDDQVLSGPVTIIK